VESDEQHLREKARLLLNRERELFELRIRHEQIQVWLNIGQLLSQTFLESSASVSALFDQVRRTLTSKLRMQRVLVYEVWPGELRPLAPLGPERELDQAASELIGAQSAGLCNDPGQEGLNPGTSALARAVGLHRFLWCRMLRTEQPPILLAAGFEQSKAAFQQPFVESDCAHLGSTARHIESLLKNASLVTELQREQEHLREANWVLEQRDLELRNATDQLRAANESLEQRVRERTLALAEKNRDLRLVLDNVDQALLTVDLDGRLAGERSSVVDRWFGECTDRPLFVEHVRAEPRFADQFNLGLEMLRDDVLPPEVCVAQMPKRLTLGERKFECHYLEISDGDRCTGLLLVVSDVTEQLARQRDEAEQRELMAALTALTRDRNGFLTWLDECERLVEDLSHPNADEAKQKRLLHTLKGNAASFGIQLVAEHCHAAETELEERTSTYQDTLFGLRAHWATLTQNLRAMVSRELRKTIEVSESDLHDLATLAQRGASSAALTAEVERLRWELVERPLTRLAQHARALGQRLGKPSPETIVQADRLRLDPERWAPLWSALIQLLRNAVDHGIETPELRSQSGKSANGRLRLAAHVASAGFLLEIEDDGRGIDWEAVRALCKKRGLPCESRADLTNAILSAGFSTRGEVTQFSGRGIGLDAVLATVHKLGGTLEVDSEPGRGTRWTLSFPSPLAS